MTTSKERRFEVSRHGLRRCFGAKGDTIEGTRDARYKSLDYARLSATG
jgi:hypothetical protein